MTSSTDEEVRAEQLRLVLEGIAQSVAVGFVVATLMLVVLWSLTSHAVLLGWYIVFLVERVTAAAFANRALRAGRDPVRDRRVERILLISKMVEGSTQGSLLLIGLPLQVPPVSILLMSFMGAICGNGVSLLAPRRHLYLALAIPIATLAVITLWSLGGIPYRVLAVCSILYVVGQYGQVVLASRRVRESIELRFEKTALVEQLRTETAIARLARREAEQANAAKSRFLAAASHDLRQPVHAVGLFLQALSQTDLESHHRQIVSKAQAANIASTDMLNTLLDFSRLEAGIVTPQPVPFALQPLLDKLENEFAPLADAKSLIYRSAQTDAAVISDAALLELVLRNFVVNAIRYTDRGGLLVGSRRRGDAVSIEVYDTGIGIPEDQREEIFHEFHQVGNPERDRRKGLGLGLAIARRLATSLHHPLSLSSQEGRGSVFRILVPSAAEPTIAHRSPEVAAVGELKGVNILVVEDDAIVREAMVHLLSGWDCRCRAIEMPAEVSSLPQDEPAPDVLICDYRLRERLTGTEAITILRRHWQRQIPAIMITGDTAPERMREASDSGIPLLHKPVPPDMLYRSLLALIR